ncbi:MAG: carboxylating nicotinate-nucleotide diphosphorylase [Acidobacteriota bacterium]|nr:carboxylating nicotinate-nucleotide diphosphorylase [Acidobacteriota bacterium]
MSRAAVCAPPEVVWRPIVEAALREDVGFRDLTTEAVVDTDRIASADFVARGPGRIAGLFLALATVHALDPEVGADVRIAEGTDALAGAVLARVEGKARAILTAERVALNFLGRLSGIATATRNVVLAVEGSRTRIVETRKTTPGLRVLEKYAVRAGGGANHRLRLDDAILIKDNHIALCGGVADAIRRARAAAGHTVRLEVEVDSLAELDVALTEGADVILLDNFDLDSLVEAVSRVGGRAVLEASGGITFERVAAVAATGVDVVSMGWLTQSAPALDVALDFRPPA